MLPVLHKPLAKLLRQKQFLPPRLTKQRKKHQRKSHQSAPQSLRNSHCQQRRQHSGINRMPYPAVRSAPDQLMIGLNRDRSAPVAAQRQPRPHREQQPQNRHHHADQQHRRTRLKNWPRQPSSPKSFPKNQQESHHRWQYMLEPLHHVLAAFRGLAEKRHRQPPNRPNHPRLSLNPECAATTQYNTRSQHRYLRPDFLEIPPDPADCASFFSSSVIHLRSARTSSSKKPTTSTLHGLVSIAFKLSLRVMKRSSRAASQCARSARICFLASGVSR